MVDFGCCEQCGLKDGEELGYRPNTDHVRLTVYHGMVLCQFCLEEEQAMAREDAKNGITTIWFPSFVTQVKEEIDLMVYSNAAPHATCSYEPPEVDPLYAVVEAGAEPEAGRLFDEDYFDSFYDAVEAAEVLIYSGKDYDIWMIVPETRLIATFYAWEKDKMS